MQRSKQLCARRSASHLLVAYVNEGRRFVENIMDEHVGLFVQERNDGEPGGIVVSLAFSA